MDERVFQIGQRIRYVGPTNRHPLRFTKHEKKPLYGTVTGLEGDESNVSYSNEPGEERMLRLAYYAETHLMVRWDPCKQPWNIAKQFIEGVD
jgi:hypothetical protein